MKKIALIAAVASLTLAGCSEPDPCLESENPAECRKWADAGGDVNDYLLYGMMGYMIGSSMSGGSKHTYIYRDPGYRGAINPAMANKYGSRDTEIRRLNQRIERQKVELKRQQAANARKNRQLRAQRAASRSSFSRSTGGRRR